MSDPITRRGFLGTGIIAGVLATLGTANPSPAETGTGGKMTGKLERLAGEETQKYTLTLKPGEGAILLLGDDAQLDAVRQEYFAEHSAVASAGKLDFLPFGFLVGSDRLDSRGEPLGLTGEEFLDRQNAVLAEAGHTAIFSYHANMSGGMARKFSASAVQYGMKPICEPTDLYYRDERLWENPKKPWAQWKDAEQYLESYLLPRLESHSQALKDDPNIWAWQPVEELPHTGEALYARYKQAFKRLLPNHLIFQIDYQQANYERLRCKQPPFADILALDYYPWRTRPEDVGLWTPSYASRAFYNRIQDYPKLAYELFRAPAVLIIQGCAEVGFRGVEEGKRWGFEQREDFVHPKMPHIRWSEKHQAYMWFHFYLAPENAWRLQSWMAIACGYKGVMVWGGGPGGSPKALAEGIRRGQNGRICLLNHDFTAHRHFHELNQTWKDLRRYEKLILSLRRADALRPFFKIHDRHVRANAFEDGQGRIYLVVVNGEIGKWDGNSPEVLDYPRTKLTVNEGGELENYQPLRKPRDVHLEILTGALHPYDLRSIR